MVVVAIAAQNAAAIDVVTCIDARVHLQGAIGCARRSLGQARMDAISQGIIIVKRNLLSA